VIERWAGLRPKGPGPDPVIGAVPDAPGLLVATGGYKIGLALAPLAGRAVADLVEGRHAGLPAGFAPRVTP
jgi:glycine/D-amino acid oxidase-like deaminating enzyme